MGNRASLSKSDRFAVFHRDDFQCQYCGRRAPDAVLEVDHVEPVSGGGSNHIDNLVTACFDCNRGKSDKVLLNVPQSQDEILERRKAKLEQIEMLAELRDQIQAREDELVQEVCRYWSSATRLTMTAKKRLMSIQMFVRKLDLLEIFEAIDIAASRKKTSTDRWLYFCGVCWRKIKDN